MLGRKPFMVIASAEPFTGFLKNARHQHKNIKNFLEDPLGNEIDTARLRSSTRTHFDIPPLTREEIERAGS